MSAWEVVVPHNPQDGSVTLRLEVPGGWIYQVRIDHEEISPAVSTVFVPA